MKMMIAALTLLSSTTYAQTSTNFSCKVQNPCQFKKSGLGYCVGRTSLRAEHSGSVLVVGRDSESPFEIFMIAAEIPVSFSAKDNALVGSTKDGDDWVTLKISPDQKMLAGKMTLEQDFEFSLVCTEQR